MNLDNAPSIVLSLVVIGFVIAMSILVAVGVQDGISHTIEVDATETFLMLEDGSTQQLVGVGDGITSISATRLNQTWLDFDGVDDFVIVTDTDRFISGNYSQYSISFWANFTGGLLNNKKIIYKFNTTDNQRGFYVRTSGESGNSTKMSFLYSNDGSNSYDKNSDLYYIHNDSKFHKYTITFDEHIVKFYRDGVWNSTHGSTSPGRQIYESNANLEIGGAAGSGTFNGSLDDIKIYDYMLTPSDITYLYTEGREWENNF